MISRVYHVAKLIKCPIKLLTNFLNMLTFSCQKYLQATLTSQVTLRVWEKISKSQMFLIVYSIFLLALEASIARLMPGQAFCWYDTLLRFLRRYLPCKLVLVWPQNVHVKSMNSFVYCSIVYVQFTEISLVFHFFFILRGLLLRSGATICMLLAEGNSYFIRLLQNQRFVVKYFTGIISNKSHNHMFWGQ